MRSVWFAAAAVAWIAALVRGYVTHRPPVALILFPQGHDALALDVLARALGGHLYAAGWAGLWVLALAAWGGPFLAWLVPAAAPRPGLGVAGRPLGRHLGLGAGFGALGIGVLALGWAGLLMPGPLALLVLLPAFGGGWRGSRGLARDFVVAIRAPASASGWGWRAAMALPILAALPSMFSPEVSWDAMVYHLRLPTFWLMEHRHFAQPDNVYTGYPCLTEAHYALVMAFSGGDRSAKLMHAACWLLGARVLFLALLPRGRTAAFGSALLWLGSPAAMLLAGMAYVDLATAWLVALTAVSLGVPLLAGVLCGLAFLTKVTGGFAFLGLLACMAGLGWRSLWRVTVGFAAAAAVWFAREWLSLGNPVYPFATGLLGGVSSATVEFWRAHPTPGADTMAGPLARIWSMAVADDAGVGAPVGCLWLAALLPAALAGLADRRWRFIAAASALWILLPLDSRYFLPFLPAGILAASPAWGTRWFRWTTGAALALLVPLGALDALQNSILEFDPLPPALGLRTMERHMRSGLPPQPEYWEAAQLCNTRLPRRSRLLFLSGIKSYRFDRRCTVPHQAVDPSPFLREYKRAGSPGRLAIRLRQAGFTHVVYLPRVSAVLPDLPELAFREPEAAGIVSWMRRFTAFDFRWGEALVYSLGRNPVPRQLGRVPFLEEYAMKEATGPGSVPVPWAMTALAKLAPESSTNGQVRGIRILMGPPPRPAEALGPLGAATRSEEASSSTWRAYAFALGETGDGMRALACYRQALELLPSDGQAHFGMGIVLARAGRLREAADEIAAAVRIEPGRAEFRQALNQVLAALR